MLSENPEPRVIGLMSFYDEPVELLSASLQGMAAAGVDHMVCMDGRYAIYPGDTHLSDANQHGAIVVTCRNLGMGCTLSIPEREWEGNEVEKRTALFALGWSLANDGDWFWVQDADGIVTDFPDNWKQRLADTEHDAASVMMHDPVMAEARQSDWPADFEIRCMFRAQPIRCLTNHCTYVADDGRVLWGQVVHGQEHGRGQVDGLHFPDIRVEHRTQQRPPERLQAKAAYYAERDASGIERGFCECGEKSIKLVARGWRISPVSGHAVAPWFEACAKHAKRWEYEGRWELRKLAEQMEGRALTPEEADEIAATIQNRNGRMPEPV